MCWSGEASALLATIGFGSTAYAAWRKEPTPVWAALGYFSLMEALQAFTYTVIDDCSSPANQIATLLGYVHITFQPFFGNALFMHFIPRDVRRSVQTPVYLLCALSALFMLVQLYTFDWAGACAHGKILCAQELCSVSGRWHIAWDVPYNAIGDTDIGVPVIDAGFYTYTVTMFILPMLYGSWKMTLYHILIGPLPARLLTDNLNELPLFGAWCPSVYCSLLLKRRYGEFSTCDIGPFGRNAFSARRIEASESICTAHSCAPTPTRAS